MTFAKVTDDFGFSHDLLMPVGQYNDFPRETYERHCQQRYSWHQDPDYSDFYWRQA